MIAICISTTIPLLRVQHVGHLRTHSGSSPNPIATNTPDTGGATTPADNLEGVSDCGQSKAAESSSIEGDEKAEVKALRAQLKAAQEEVALLRQALPSERAQRA